MVLSRPAVGPRPAVRTAAVCGAAVVALVLVVLWSRPEFFHKKNPLQRRNAVRRRPPAAVRASPLALSGNEIGVGDEDESDHDLAADAGDGQQAELPGQISSLISPAAPDGETATAQPAAAPAPGSTSTIRQTPEEIRAQHVASLLYQIARDDAANRAIIHRGVSCAGCGTRPIRGIRYACLQCADFSLCAGCEEVVGHEATHVFAKLRVAAPFFFRSQRRHPAGLPGIPGQGKHSCPPSVSSRITAEFGLDFGQIEALYTQFCCFATGLIATGFASDGTARLIPGMGFDGFCASLPIQVTGITVDQSFFHRRVFELYQPNPDTGLLTFEQTLRTSTAARSGSTTTRLSLAFLALDADMDGYISRGDVVRFLMSLFEIQSQVARDRLGKTTFSAWQAAAWNSQPLNGSFAVNPNGSDASFPEPAEPARPANPAVGNSAASSRIKAPSQLGPAAHINYEDLERLRRYMGAAGFRVEQLLSIAETEEAILQSSRTTPVTTNPLSATTTPTGPSSASSSSAPPSALSSAQESTEAADHEPLRKSAILSGEWPMPAITGHVASDLVALAFSDRLDRMFRPVEVRAAISRRSAPVRRQDHIRAQLDEIASRGGVDYAADLAASEDSWLQQWPVVTQPVISDMKLRQLMDYEQTEMYGIEPHILRQLARDSLFDRRMGYHNAAGRVEPRLNQTQFAAAITADEELQFTVAWIGLVAVL